MNDHNSKTSLYSILTLTSVQLKKFKQRKLIIGYNISAEIVLLANTDHFKNDNLSADNLSCVPNLLYHYFSLQTLILTYFVIKLVIITK